MSSTAITLRYNIVLLVVCVQRATAHLWVVHSPQVQAHEPDPNADILTGHKLQEAAALLLVGLEDDLQGRNAGRQAGAVKKQGCGCASGLGSSC